MLKKHRVSKYRRRRSKHSNKSRIIKRKSSKKKKSRNKSTKNKTKNKSIKKKSKKKLNGGFNIKINKEIKVSGYNFNRNGQSAKLDKLYIPKINTFI